MRKVEDSQRRVSGTTRPRWNCNRQQQTEKTNVRRNRWANRRLEHNQPTNPANITTNWINHGKGWSCRRRSHPGLYKIRKQHDAEKTDEKGKQHGLRNNFECWRAREGTNQQLKEDSDTDKEQIKEQRDETFDIKKMCDHHGGKFGHLLSKQSLCCHKPCCLLSAPPKTYQHTIS